jgi:hypothetical protein
LPAEEEQRSFGGPDEAQSARGGSVALGLLPAPEIPQMIAEKFRTELPELLSRGVDDRVSWEVSVVCDSLTGSYADAIEVLDVGCERMLEEDWDLAICMTDLPLRTNRWWPVVAAVSTARKTAVLSLPPLGATRLRRRAGEAIVQLVNELYEGDPELGRDRENGADREVDTGANAGEARHPAPRPRRLVGRRLTELVFPIRRVMPTDEDIDVRFVSPRVRGHLRLLAGMVLANRPWRLFTTMRSVLAAAFATAAYVLVVPTIWQLGDALGLTRLFLLMVLAIAAMVVWITVAHNLWERPTDLEARHQTALYNTATALTITMAVLFSYAVLFVLVLVVAGIFVPNGFFQSTLQRPVGTTEYVILSWLTASLATVAGALGSGLEDEDTVREATYGYRQRRRNWPNDSEGDSNTQ